MQFKRKLKQSGGVDMIPMIDVVFQLILFFLLSSTFIKTPGIAIQLPEASVNQSVKYSELVITIPDDHSVYLNKKRLTFNELDNELAAITPEEKIKYQSVLVEGEKSIQYQTSVQVLAILAKNGFPNVGLRVREPD